MSKIDLHALAMEALECAAVAIRKADPKLTVEQAFAKACERHPDVLKIERRAAAQMLAGVPVARTEPKILADLSDDEINSLTIQIKAADPFLDDAGIIQILTQRVAAGDIDKSLTDADLLRLADYERRLNPSLSDREVHARVARRSRGLPRPQGVPRRDGGRETG